MTIAKGNPISATEILAAIAASVPVNCTSMSVVPTGASVPHAMPDVAAAALGAAPASAIGDLVMAVFTGLRQSTDPAADGIPSGSIYKNGEFICIAP